MVLLVMLHLILLSTAYLIFLERKVAAWAQDRIGPNRTNLSFGVLPFPEHWKMMGLGQALADGIKLLVKEDYTPPRVDKRLFLLAPVLAVIPAMIAWAVIPWGGVWVFPGIGGLVEPGIVTVAVAPLTHGLVYILAIGSLAVYGVTLAGYASNNKYSFLGGLRATAQMLSYEIPMGLVVLILILHYRTMDPAIAIEQQMSEGWFGLSHAWGIVAHPLLAVIFFTCLLAEANRAPFDLAEAEQELVGGFHTEFGSMKWALFFLGEYIHMITGCAFFAILFLGGWALPIPVLNLLPATAEGWWGILLVLLKVGVFSAKVTFLLFVMMWVRWTLPRFRFDQLMKLAWRGMIPLMLVMLLVTGVLAYFGMMQWWWTLPANLIVAAAAAVISPRLPQGPPVNRRIGLAGSRYSPLTPAGG